jgi:hypothetical protein
MIEFGELGNIGEEAVVGYLEVLSQHLGGTEETHE